MTKSRLSTLLAATLMAGGLIMGTPAQATPLTPFTGTDLLAFDVGTQTATGGSFVSVTSTVLEWVDESAVHSFLRIIEPPSNLPATILSDTGGWVNIAQLQHENNVITVASFSFTIDMLDSFTLAGATFAATGNDTLGTSLGISFLETPNVAPCPGLNPLGSTCDDTFTISGLGPVLGSFLFNDGNEDYSITFRILATQADGSFFDSGGNIIYTAENATTNLLVQAQINQVNQVPEPGSLALLGIGLVGLPLFARRAKKADAKKADAKKA